MINEFDLFQNLKNEPKSLSHQPNTQLLKTLNDCEHVTKEQNGYSVCISCGKVFRYNLTNSNKEWKYYGLNSTDPSRTHIRKIETKSIHKDIEALNLGEDVVFTANNMYREVTKNKIFRAKSRKSIVFACVFNAYKKLGIPQTPDRLFKLFDLKRKVALKGLKMVGMKLKQDSVTVQPKYITPDIIIKDILENFSTHSNQVDQVVSIYHNVKNRSSKLNRSRPKSVASGIVYYWICNNNKHITLKEFATIVSLSELTIQRISKEVENILKNKNQD